MDIKDASMRELSQEMVNRCKAQKEFYAAVWGKSQDDIVESIYTGMTGTLIGNLIHLSDMLREEMLNADKDINEEKKEF